MPPINSAGTTGVRKPPSVRAELDAILKRFDVADQRLRRAENVKDRELAEAERRETEGFFFGVTRDAADLFLLLLRQCVRHRKEALKTYLVSLLDDEFDELAEAIAKLQRGKSNG